MFPSAGAQEGLDGRADLWGPAHERTGGPAGRACDSPRARAAVGAVAALDAALPAGLRRGPVRRGPGGVHPGGLRLAGGHGRPPGPAPGSVRGGHGDPALRVGLESESPLPRARARRGVHAVHAGGGAGVSCAAPAHGRRDRHDLGAVHARVQKLLRRCGRLPEEPSPSDPVAEQMPLLAGYAAASIQERVATGPRAGHPMRRLRSAAAVVDGDKPRCARLEGSRCTPTWRWPRPPASSSSTCAGTCCARLWRWRD